ncbi:MarC family protein [Egbenema bharatensis]|uniref:MarC family protein n=1 Tax=Egbenema bharatensis TaxID=3463334 RepID=UPI003A86DF10
MRQFTCQAVNQNSNHYKDMLLAQAPTNELPPLEGNKTAKERIADRIAKTPLESPIGVFNLFIIFFVTLGPLKTIPTFAQLTQQADEKLRQQLAFRSTAIATIVLLLVSIIGQNMLRVWQVRLPALLIGGGILLFLVALRIVLSEYAPPQKADPPDPPTLNMAVSPLAFPTIAPPFGIAIALTIMVMAPEIGVSPLIVLGLLVLVMLLNLIGMLAARPILAFLKPVTLRIVGFALGVLQLALGIEWIITGLEIEVLVLRRLLES